MSAVYSKIEAKRIRFAFVMCSDLASSVGAADEATGGAALGVAAQRRRPTQLDGAHHAPLDATQVTIMRAATGVAVAAEDIRHFQTGRHTADGSGGRHDFQPQPVERALRPSDKPVRDPRVAGRARQIGVTERSRVIMHLGSTH